MATSDITSLTGRITGFDADLVVEGYTTGATYAFGLGTNSADVASAKGVITSVSLGYDNTGAATTVSRTVRLTSTVRKPWPTSVVGAPVKDETGGGNLSTRLALSEPLFQKDQAGGGNSGTDPVATLLAALVTNTGGASQTSNARTGFTVTNSSTLGYPKCVARWATVGFQRVTGNFLIEMSGMHPFFRNGNPFACVIFTCTDQHSNSVSYTITSMTKTTLDGDANVISVYAATIDVTTLTQGDVLTCQFKAYPYVGDSTAVLDTAVDGVAAPSAALTPLMMLLDKTDTLACYASVDGVGAGTPTVQNTAALARTTPYASVALAFTALKAFNNTNHSSNTLDNCIILMQNGSYTGAGTFTGSNTKSRCRIMSDLANGATEAGVIFSTSSGTACNAYLEYKDVTFSGSGSGMLRGNVTTGILWVNSCTINHTSTSFCYAWRLIDITQCTITAWTQGMLSFSTNKGPYGLIRGNDASSVSGGIRHQIYCVIGNKGLNGSTSSNSWQESGNAQGNDASDCIVYAFNSIYGSTTLMANAWATTSNVTLGIAIFGNVGERITNNTQGMFYTAADDSNFNTVNNVYIINNTIVGERENFCYQEGGNTTVTRNNWYDICNLFYNFNTKCDTFANAARTVTDAVFTSGLTTVTSATAAFVAGDVGNIFSADSCISGGVGSIASRTSATIIDLAVAATASGTGIKIGINGYIQNAARVGNWAWLYGCGCYGSRYEKADFPRDFAGIDVAVVGVGSMGYTNNQSVSAGNAGNGSYLPVSSSPAIARIPSGKAPFPFDLLGHQVANNGTGAAGAIQPYAAYSFPRTGKRSRSKSRLLVVR